LSNAICYNQVHAAFHGWLIIWRKTNKKYPGYKLQCTGLFGGDCPGIWTTNDFPLFWYYTWLPFSTLNWTYVKNDIILSI